MNISIDVEFMSADISFLRNAELILFVTYVYNLKY